MTRIHVGRFIIINLIDLNPDGSGRYVGGNIVSSNIKDNLRSDKYNNMMEGIEKMVLSHATNGLDVSDPVYVRGLSQAIESSKIVAKNSLFKRIENALSSFISGH